VAPDRVTLRVGHRGPSLLRIAYTPYWHADGGAAVLPAAGSRWTIVCAPGAGMINLRARVDTRSIERRLGLRSPPKCL
jgi:hypothetical protein